MRTAATNFGKNLVTQLQTMGVALWREGESIRWRAASGVMTHEVVAQLKASKSEILSFLSFLVPGVEPAPAMFAADRGGELPLSYAQQRLWFLVQLDEAAGAAYHMPDGLRLQGVLYFQSLPLAAAA